MPFDFKKEYKEFYLPKNKPEIVTVPAANYIAVQGKCTLEGHLSGNDPLHHGSSHFCININCFLAVHNSSLRNLRKPQ